jgi:hypothetical protein
MSRSVLTFASLALPGHSPAGAGQARPADDLEVGRAGVLPDSPSLAFDRDLVCDEGDIQRLGVGSRT